MVVAAGLRDCHLFETEAEAEEKVENRTQIATQRNHTAALQYKN
jgi:hypothetical protein